MLFDEFENSDILRESIYGFDITEQFQSNQVPIENDIDLLQAIDKIKYDLKVEPKDVKKRPYTQSINVEFRKLELSLESNPNKENDSEGYPDNYVPLNGENHRFNLS